MLSALRHWLGSTPIVDELQRRQAVTVQLLFLFLGVAVPVVWLPRLLQPGFSIPDAVGSLGMAGLAWIGLLLLRRGKYLWAVWGFVGALLLAMLSVYLSTGLLGQLSSQATHSLGLLLAALLIGRRALWLALAVSLLAVFGGLGVDLAAGRREALSSAVSVSLSYLLLSLVLDRFATAYREVLNRERERTGALDAANARIRAEAADRERLQRALSAAQQRDAAELVGSGLAHELNNVLAVTYAQLAKAPAAATEEQARAFARVKDSLDDAAERIHRVLQLVRRDEMDLVELDLAKLVSRMEPDLRSLLGPRRLRLSLPDTPSVRGFETDVAQILLAVVANAGQATDESGEICIELRQGHRAEQEGLLLEVSDNGCGMSAESLAAVGQTLFAGAVARRNRDSGLGLLTCRALAERMGGALCIRSAPGQGTTVGLWLPLPQHRFEPLCIAAKLDPRSVLLVDDDPDVGALLSFVLTDAGFQVEIAETADAARLAQQRVGGRQPLLVMDRNLPDGDGVALLEEFARQASGLRAVFSSVQALKAHERERLSQVHLVELAKPYVPERLVQTLKDLGKAA